jgi:hypothetical protein
VRVLSAFNVGPLDNPRLPHCWQARKAHCHGISFVETGARFRATEKQFYHFVSL